MIQADRLADTFISLVKIDSVSRNEAEIAGFLKTKLEELGASVVMDDAAEAIGGACGNMVAKFSGTRDVPPLLLNAHMDRVEPGVGIEPVLKDGVFTSAGDTILGSDDKSAIAALLEVLTVIKDADIPHGPLEIVLTVAEEIGLVGAKHMDFSLISAPYGYSLDAWDVDGIVTRSPSANRIEFDIHGRDAHAGAKPEDGVNAILIAARAMAGLELGRIDDETTCNIGLIKGGVATNIVPSLVEIRGEARSRDAAKLDEVTKKIVAAFENAVEEERKKSQDQGDDLPRLETRVESDFKAIDVPDDHPVVTLAMEAAKRLGRELKTKPTGGGADANMFFAKGIITGVLGTGMSDVHTVRESVSLEDMTKCAELVLEIIKLHGEKA